MQVAIKRDRSLHQPEEQHGFRKHRRMDEHLLTATLFLDKAWDKGIPVWIVSLDLSKVFDWVNWNALWLALHDHGISDHLVWILQLIYANQLGEVQGEHSNSDPFSHPRRSATRMCVEPTLVLQRVAMGNVQAECGNKEMWF